MAICEIFSFFFISGLTRFGSESISIEIDRGPGGGHPVSTNEFYLGGIDAKQLKSLKIRDMRCFQSPDKFSIYHNLWTMSMMASQNIKIPGFYLKYII